MKKIKIKSGFYDVSDHDFAKVINYIYSKFGNLGIGILGLIMMYFGLTGIMDLF
jgi:hypothetical protein